MLLAAVLGLSLAHAEVRFSRAPEEAEEGELGPAPLSTRKGDYRKWRVKAARRAAYAGLDAALRWRADAVDACVRAGGGAAGPAEVTVSVDRDGGATVKAGAGADARLAGCVAEVFDGERLPLPMTGAVRLTYGVAWVDAPVATAGATAPADPLAFAPRLDEDRGFGNVEYGAPAATIEGLSAVNWQEATTFYARASDLGMRWLGVPVFDASYAVGADGFFAVTLGVVGTSEAWRLREALTARYGQPRWDNRFGAFFWRGERVLVQYRPAGETVTVTILDLARARASGLVDGLPGDPVDPTSPDTSRRLPRIFRDG